MWYLCILKFSYSFVLYFLIGNMTSTHNILVVTIGTFQLLGPLVGHQVLLGCLIWHQPICPCYGGSNNGIKQAFCSFVCLIDLRFSRWSELVLHLLIFPISTVFSMLVKKILMGCLCCRHREFLYSGPRKYPCEIWQTFWLVA